MNIRKSDYTHLLDALDVHRLRDIALLPKYLTHDNHLVRHIAEKKYRELIKSKPVGVALND